MEIKKFEELIKPTLKDGQTLVSIECKRLLSSGENYGSVMLHVQYKVLTENGQEEVFECVAKTCPPIGRLWEDFNIKTTFKKEIATYYTIIPCLNDFGNDMGVDCLLECFPKCIGARISLDNNSNEVDENAVLLLENLKIEGYNIGNRFIGLDLDSAKIVLQDLATLHASVIAFKLAKPSEFKEKLLPHLESSVFAPPEDEVQALVDMLAESVALNHKCVPHLSKVRQLVEQMNIRRANKIDTSGINDSYTTLSHNDFWLNNTMLKYVNGNPLKNKMVDFQSIDCSSIGNDVIFFMYSSVSVAVLENHADELFKVYYDKFIQTLTQVKCDITSYTFQGMMDEFAATTKREQFLHVFFMLFPIMMEKNSAKDIAEMKGGDFVKDRRAFHDNFAIRAQFVLLEFVKRGWI